MFDRRLSLVCAALGLTSVMVVIGGCADEDPRFGGAGAIETIRVFPPRTPMTEGGAGLTPVQLFGQVYDALKVSCGGCHAPPGAAGAPVFFATDAVTSYPIFKSRNYHLEGGKPATSMYGLVERAGHVGPALTDAEKSLIAQWRAAEKVASSAPSDAGGGG